MSFSEYAEISFAEHPNIQEAIENEILKEYGQYENARVEPEIHIEKYDPATKETIIRGTFIGIPYEKMGLSGESYGTFKAKVKFIGKGKKWADFEHIETFDLTTDWFN